MPRGFLRFDLTYGHQKCPKSKVARIAATASSRQILAGLEFCFSHCCMGRAWGITETRKPHSPRCFQRFIELPLNIFPLLQCFAWMYCPFWRRRKFIIEFPQCSFLCVLFQRQDYIVVLFPPLFLLTWTFDVFIKALEQMLNFIPLLDVKIEIGLDTLEIVWDRCLVFSKMKPCKCFLRKTIHHCFLQYVSWWGKGGEKKKITP